ncbi:ATP-binding protein [Kribbella sp. CA-253562]|uniref:ATP-binding protein n=1 Tax=Kribbella sp. CA-253562 TaxID=3239942 RepID=UPI003D8E8566
MFPAELLLAECDDRPAPLPTPDQSRSVPRSSSLRDFDFDANPNVDPAVINFLAISAWVEKDLPQCLMGDSGTSNSHLLIALGTEVKYALAANELVEAADEVTLTETIARYGRVDVLCIDELGYVQLDRRSVCCCSGFDRHARRRTLSRSLRMSRSPAGQDLHRDVRRDRRPAHLRREHHRDRHRVLRAPTASPRTPTR